MSAIGTILLVIGLIALAIFNVLLVLFVAALIFFKASDELPPPIALVVTIFIMSLLSAVILIPLGILIA